MKVIVEFLYNDTSDKLHTLNHSFQKAEESWVNDNKKMWDKDETLEGYKVYVDKLLYDEQQRELEELRSKIARAKFALS